MTTDKNREAFEAWYGQTRWTSPKAFQTKGNGEYLQVSVCESYAVWQASRTAALNEAVSLFDAQGLHLLMSPPPQQLLKDLRDGN